MIMLKPKHALAAVSHIYQGAVTWKSDRSLYIDIVTNQSNLAVMHPSLRLWLKKECTLQPATLANCDAKGARTHKSFSSFSSILSKTRRYVSEFERYGYID